jgi:hypothetical protein
MFAHERAVYVTTWDGRGSVRLIVGTSEEGGPQYLGGHEAAWKLSPLEKFPGDLVTDPRGATRSTPSVPAVRIEPETAEILGDTIGRRRVTSAPTLDTATETDLIGALARITLAKPDGAVVLDGLPKETLLQALGRRVK